MDFITFISQKQSKMKSQTFLHNLVKIAKAPSLEQMPVLELTKADIKELISLLDDESVPYTVDNGQELRFDFAGVKFFVVENDKNEDTDLYGKLITPAKYDAILSPEEQVVADANTFTGEPINPVAGAVNSENQEVVDQRTQAEADLSKDTSKKQKDKAKS